VVSLLLFPDGTYIIISGLVASLLIVSFLLLFVLLKKKKEKYMPGDKNQKEKSESYFTNIYSNILWSLFSRKKSLTKMQPLRSLIPCIPMHGFKKG
jgi:hypothetical protein